MSKETRVVHVKVVDGGSIKKTSKGSDNLGKSLSSTGKVGGAVFSKLDALSGGLLSSMKSLVPAIGGVSGSFKGLRAAIISTGIGALVIGVVALMQAFKRSEEGQNKMAKAMAMIGAFTGQLLDKVADLGEFIIDAFTNPMESLKNFANLIKENIVNRFEGMLELVPALGEAIGKLFKGEFSEAGKIATDAVAKVALGVDSVTESLKNATQAGKDFVAETAKEVEAMARIADSRAKIDKDQRKLNIDRAKADAEISDLRSKAENAEMFTAAERLEFTKQAAVKQEEIINREKAIIAEKLKNQLAENALGKSTKADLDAANALQVELIQKETALNNFKKLNFARQKALSAEARAAAKKDAKDSSDEDKAAFAKLQEDLNKLELAQLDLTAQEKLDANRANHLKELDAMKIADDEKKALREQIQAYYDAEDEKLKDKDREKADALVEKIEQDKMTDLKKLEYQKEQDLLKLKDLEGYEQAREDIQTRFKEQSEALEENSNRMKQDMAIGYAQSTLGAMGSMMKQGSKEQKSFAIASATMDMYSGMSKVWGLFGTPEVASDMSMKIAASASILATGLSNIRNISKVGKGGGGSTPSGGASAQPPSINVIGRTTAGERMIGSAIGDLGNKPSRAYIVESDMASNTALQRRVNDTSSMG